MIKKNSELAQENQDLTEEIDESVEIPKKDQLVLELAQENNEKDVVLDEVIRKNSELAQENQDLTDEINESVEIAKEKDRLVLELAQKKITKRTFFGRGDPRELGTCSRKKTPFC